MVSWGITLIVWLCHCCVSHSYDCVCEEEFLSRMIDGLGTHSQICYTSIELGLVFALYLHVALPKSQGARC
jgi:hypothetical protein